MAISMYISLYKANMHVILGKLLIQVKHRLSFPTQSSCYLRFYTCLGIVDGQTQLTIAIGGKVYQKRYFYMDPKSYSILSLNN